MGQRRGFVIALTALAGALALVACGGSSSGSGSGEGAETKAAFVKSGNEICKEFQMERDELVHRSIEELHGKEATVAQKKQATFALLNDWNRTVEKLGELTPPAADQAEVEEMIKAMKTASMKKRQEPLTRHLGQADLFLKADTMAKKYGLGECFV